MISAILAAPDIKEAAAMFVQAAAGLSRLVSIDCTSR